MPTVTWKPSLPPIEMDPNNIQDIKFDMTAWLEGDEVNGAGSSALSEGCEAAVSDTTATTAFLRVTGPGDAGAGTEGKATLRLATVNGRQKDMSIRLKFKQQ